MSRRRLLPLALILIVAGLLTLVLQEYTRQLIMPFLFIVWIGRLLFATIPQAIIWGVFIAIALLIAARTLFKRRPSPPAALRSHPPPEGRIENWARLIERSKQEAYYRWQLAQPLQALMVDVLAHRQRSTPRQIKELLAANALDLPPEIEAYLQASKTSFSHLLTDRSPFRPGSGSTPTPLDLAPEKIIQFLEDQLDYHLH
jgi:hypothetical protein